MPNVAALSRSTLANVRQNLFWAFVYTGVPVPVAAGALYPEFGVLSPSLVAVPEAVPREKAVWTTA